MTNPLARHISDGAGTRASVDHENMLPQLSETYRIIARVLLVTAGRPAAPGAPKAAKSELRGAVDTYFNDL